MRIEVRVREQQQDFAVYVNDELIESGFSDSKAALQHARALAAELVFEGARRAAIEAFVRKDMN